MQLRSHTSLRQWACAVELSLMHMRSLRTLKCYKQTVLYSMRGVFRKRRWRHSSSCSRKVACCAVQGSLVAGQYKIVNSGSELLDQLANATARYIGVGNSLSLPPNLGIKRITVSR